MISCLRFGSLCPFTPYIDAPDACEAEPRRDRGVVTSRVRTRLNRSFPDDPGDLNPTFDRIDRIDLVIEAAKSSVGICGPHSESVVKIQPQILDLKRYVAGNGEFYPATIDRTVDRLICAGTASWGRPVSGRPFQRGKIGNPPEHPRLTTRFRVWCFMSAIKCPPRPLRHDDLKIPRSERKTVNTLLPGDCRWPIGDPLHRDFHFCGKRRVEGDPYCEFHMHRGFKPARPRVPNYWPRAAA